MDIKCPRCGQITSFKGNPYRPFCSERCKLIDLGHWISGSYRISKDEDDETAEERPEEEKPQPRGGDED